jgi:hypothetical protein
MSMFTLRGEVVHVYTAPKGVSKKTGEEYGGQDKVQIIGDIPLKGGETRKELISLTTDQGVALEKMQGKIVVCPVSFFANGKSVSFFIPEGHKIKLIDSQNAA